MGCFTKSKAVIAYRRELKSKVVEMLVTCGEIAPIATTLTLTGEQTGNITVLAGNFWRGLSNADKNILRTAKGSNPPAVTAATSYGRHSLPEFLELPTKTIVEVGCMGSWTELAMEWAQHIVELNPHTFPDGWEPFRLRLEQARNTVVVDNQAYITNPYGRGLPRNADQAFAYMIFQAGFLDVDENPNDPGLPIQWRGLLRAIPREHVTPNITALVERKGYLWARKKCQQDYGF